MKYIVSVCIFFLSFFSVFADDPCKYNVDTNTPVSIWDALDDCLDQDSSLVNSSGDIQIEWKGKEFIAGWTTALAQLLGLLAVGAIVYGGLLMTLSGWDDEKIKKWKDVVKWAIIWFLWVVTAGALVRILIEFIFAIGG